jgi:ATP-dependent helicase/nuclease subunit A
LAAEDGRTRGLAIHRLLQLLCEGQRDPLGKVAQELNLAMDHPGLKEWLKEAEQVFHSPQLQHLFHGTALEQAYNEVPLQYEREGERVYGIIDRLVVSGDQVYLVDYKSHRLSNASQAQTLKTYYQTQMDYYRRGVEQLWPDKTLHCGLILTQPALWVDM